MKDITLKYRIERLAQNAWPTYVSYAEDITLRDAEKLSAKYDGLSPVFWDMTNILAYAFSDADLNSITYSKYYAQNYFKGGVSNQLCGWIVTEKFWTGAVSDTDYNKIAEYLKEQEHFQDNDLIREEIVLFTDIYNNGYQAKMVVWHA